MMLNPWVILALVVGWGISLAGAFHFGTSYEEGQEAKEKVLIDKVIAAKREDDQTFSDTFGGVIEARLSKIRINNTTTVQEIHHEREIQTRVLDNPDCALPDSTTRLLNHKRGYGGGADGSGTSKPEVKVPTDGGTPGKAAGGTGSGR